MRSKKYFKWSIDWEGQNYLGLTLEWTCAKNYIDISMPGYIPTALHKFQHKPPSYTQDAPHPCNKPVYGKHIQFATQKSYTPKLNSAYTNRVQSINGNFLYYSCSVDPTIIPALNLIFTWQSALTQDTMENTTKFWIMHQRMGSTILMQTQIMLALLFPKPAVALQAGIILQTVLSVILRVPPLQTAIF